MIDIYSHFSGYESNKGLAIIYDFTACLIIKSKHMVNVSKKNIAWIKYKRLWNLTESHFQTITNSLYFIAQWAVKSWIIATIFIFLTIKMFIYYFLSWNICKNVKLPIQFLNPCFLDTLYILSLNPKFGEVRIEN